ncbi:hypothetical protein C1632_02425 [Microbacterium testaceum]|uniref:hypothetical protein n=1 Tax=Microbacterium testaceum TaxID=2033 RepID=UPI000CCE042B|nr:hypothetical protein [Microbacterium testaceum]PNW10635.1 hypothetical protein C1632_02425 [Microbacterium testaceum]
MTARPGFPAVSGAATFQDIRRSLSGQLARSAAGVLRTGILPITTDRLMVGTSSMVVNVQTCVIVHDRNGAVYLPNDGVQPVQLSSAPSSGSRWSIVYSKQRETEAPFSDTAAGPLIDKVESTTSETAARNLLPPGARELGVWKVDAGTTTTNAASGVTYTETVPYTAMEGGVVLLRNAAEMDAWAPHDGAQAYRLDTKTLYVRAGGLWSPVAGVMPRITLYPNGSQTVNNQFGVSNWGAPGVGGSDQSLGTDWFEYVVANGIGVVKVKKAGRYRVVVRMSVQNASGQGIAAYIINNGDTTNPLAQDTVLTHPNYGTMLKLDLGSIPLAADSALGLYIPAASSALALGGTGRAAGQFDVQYLGPIS